MKPDWTPLDRELAVWTDSGSCLPIWWRDDDATEPTQALDQLIGLADQINLPVHLAVIPATATETLARLVQGQTRVVPVVHGWSHRNHAPSGAKKAEFGTDRPLADMVDDASRGLARLSGLFGPALRPMFVPPWNRIAPQMVAALPDLGFQAVSTFTPRGSSHPVAGLEQINTHLDPIDWRRDRGLVDPDALVAQVVRQLADRRLGRADNAEPYGILTHHLVHDAAIWAFTEQLFSRMLNGPVRPWTADELNMKKDLPT
jgi:hypothetical protein